MMQPSLPITPTHDASETMRFDRRQYPRRSAGGAVAAMRRNHQPYAYRQRRGHLRLVDISDGGIRAISDVPWQVHEAMVLFFEPHGLYQGFDQYGHVIRCHPTEQGYEVAIRFDQRLAA